MFASTEIGFIGGGMMASALIKGFTESGVVDVAHLHVSDPLPGICNKHHLYGLHSTHKNSEVAQVSNILWIAVEPEVVPLVITEILPELKAGTVVVSVAAGLTTQYLESMLPGFPVFRVMPNLPCVVAEAAMGYTAGMHVSAEDQRRVKQLLDCVGKAKEVPEKLLDAVTGLSGSGPAYAFMMIDAMADGGVRMGLSRSVATQLAAQTLRGAATMVLHTDAHPCALKDEVCSPGGTTIAAVEALEEKGFRSAIICAVVAATMRSRELSYQGDEKNRKDGN